MFENKKRRKKRSNSALDLVARVRKKRQQARLKYRLSKSAPQALKTNEVNAASKGKGKGKGVEESEKDEDVHHQRVVFAFAPLPQEQQIGERQEEEEEKEEEREREREREEEQVEIHAPEEYDDCDTALLLPCENSFDSVEEEEEEEEEEDANQRSGGGVRDDLDLSQGVAVKRGGSGIRIPKDPKKGMGCGRCRYSKRGCERCGTVVQVEQGKTTLPQQKKESRATPLSKMKYKKKADASKKQNPSKAEAGTKSLGCSKCRFNTRGCARCKAKAGASTTKKQLKPKTKVKAQVRPPPTKKISAVKPQKVATTEQKKKASGTGLGCSKCRFNTRRGCARCKSKAGLSAAAPTRPPKPQKKTVPAVMSAPRKEKLPVKARGEKRKDPSAAKEERRQASKKLHLTPSGKSVPVQQESPKSVLESHDEKLNHQKHGQEHCFPKLAKFVRPVRIPLKSGSLFRDSETQEQSTARGVAADSAAVRRDEEHTWKNPNWWNYKDASIRNAVKDVLHMSSSHETTQEAPRIRNEEWSTVRNFILEKLRKRSSGSLYISGVPGSGKSFIVDQAISSSLKLLFGNTTKKRTKVVKINCMTLEDPRRIFGVLLEKAFGKQCTSSAYEKDHRFALDHLRKAVSSSTSNRSPGDMVILVLDEFDHLYQNQGDILYDLFSLAEIKSSNVLLVGIANSIDLTHRLLPHLERFGVQPAMLNFRAYQHSELYALMQERLQSLDGPVFDAKAVELCCRKIAASSGDMRQCLNAAHAAFENHVAHMRESEGSENVKKFVDLQHMSLALGKCLKLPLINGMRALPQHQQMILCSTALMEEGEILLTSLFTRYNELCKSTKICALAFNEFENACTSLHDQGLAALNKKANLHSKALKLKVKKGDIVFALQGIRFYHNILSTL